MQHSAAPQTPNFYWLGLEAPRYTSYPTSPHFTGQIDRATHQKWLGELQSNASVSVYIHIPFCNEMCWFCGCHTKVTKRYEPIKKYVTNLLQEIATIKKHTGSNGILQNIHFGGGSPSLLEPNDLNAILTAIKTAFKTVSIDEQAIELDPRTTTPENIEVYATSGFNRVSIGIQDFDANVQKAINRIQPFEMVQSVMQNLKSSGLTQINCDLVYGLPQQTPERFLDSLQKTISLEPDRIALFSYAHVPHIKKHQRLIIESDLSTPQQKLALYQMGCELLAKNGYVAIGIDHFAKPNDPMAKAMQNGSLKRNFQGYVTSTTDALIGIGCSAISQLPQGYVQNTTNSADYILATQNGQLPSTRGFALNAQDIATKEVIDNLMCFLEVDLAQIRHKHGLNVHHFSKQLLKLQAPEFENILKIHNEKITITTPYRMAARVVATMFDEYKSSATATYSKVA